MVGILYGDTIIWREQTCDEELRVWGSCLTPCHCNGSSQAYQFARTTDDDNKKQPGLALDNFIYEKEEAKREGDENAFRTGRACR